MSPDRDGLLEKPAIRLVRFRADPTKVRVAIRSVEEGWLVTVSLRNRGGAWTFSSRSPEQAIMAALAKAKVGGADGVNLDGEQVYDHPFPDPL